MRGNRINVAIAVCQYIQYSVAYLYDDYIPFFIKLVFVLRSLIIKYTPLKCKHYTNYYIKNYNFEAFKLYLYGTIMKNVQLQFL